jgi:selenoprotein W-related protein
LPRASSLQAVLTQRYPDAQIELIEGSGGIFEVAKDGQLIFSKKQVGRFPELNEILRQL